MTSLQETNPERPYSQLELENIRRRTFKNLRLNTEIYAIHDNCKHFYRVKRYSKKEKDIMDGKRYIGNCSLCWNINNNTGRVANIQDLENDINFYLSFFEDEAINNNKIKLTYNAVMVETDLLNWLVSS